MFATLTAVSCEKDDPDDHDDHDHDHIAYVEVR